jgi:hypothetical protein
MTSEEAASAAWVYGPVGWDRAREHAWLRAGLLGETIPKTLVQAGTGSIIGNTPLLRDMETANISYVIAPVKTPQTPELCCNMLVMYVVCKCFG